MTNPLLDTAQSGEAVDAVRTLQSELSSEYSEIRSAEVQLAEAILTAHAVTTAGRDRLHDIQRQLIEAINNPIAALDTPTGERQFLLFLRGKIAEIQDIVDTGALTDEDHARLTRALGTGYLLPSSGSEGASPSPAATGATALPANQAGGMLPALSSALGALPQAAQGAATAPAGLAGAASPLAGLASGLLERAGDTDDSEDAAGREPPLDEDADAEGAEPDAESDDGGERADDTGQDDDPGPGGEDWVAPPPPPGNREPPAGPAQTRPAVRQ